MTDHLKVVSTENSAPKKSNLKTHVHIVLDRSGSMNSCRQSTINGFNEYINSLKADKESKYFVTLTQFDSTQVAVSIEKTFSDLPINKVPELTWDSFQPRGMTPLLDAIGSCIHETEKMISKKRGANAVVMMIMTDGDENSSREYSKAAIKNLIEDKENNAGWTVAYLGANQDAIATGASMGFAAGKAMTYSTSDMDRTFKSMADTTIKRSGVYAQAFGALADGDDVDVAFAAAAKSAFFEDDSNA